MSYSPEAIFEAAHSIRPYLSELLGAELAIEVSQKLVELLTQAAKGQPVENQILELLASHDSTREWLGSRLNKEEPGKLRHWDLKSYGIKNGDIEENDSSSIDCYVKAEMDDHVIVQRVTTIEVNIPASLSATTVSQHCRFQKVKKQPIVLLNACQIGRTGYALTGISGFAQAFLKGGVGAFIGSLWAVGDRPARVFQKHSILLCWKALI